MAIPQNTIATSADNPASTTSTIASYIDASPSPFHVIATATSILVKHGYSHYQYDQALPTQPGKYVITKAGALLAIDTTHLSPHSSFRIIGAHSDSPNLRIKQHPHPAVPYNGVTSMLCEPYGRVLLYTWLDRDLSIAGRIITRQEGSLHTTLVHTPPVMAIPSLAIHLSEDRNQPSWNKQHHFNPIFSLHNDTLFTYLSRLYPNINPEQIIGYDLMAAETNPCAYVGSNQEFITGPRFDNQMSVFCAITALIQPETTTPNSAYHNGALTRQVVPAVVIFDHEEIGSTSERGAHSHFLTHLLERLCLGRNLDRHTYLEILARSIMYSADMAHATHPNYSDRHEPQHLISLGAGPVVKINYNLRYATDGEGIAHFRAICEQANIPYQEYIHRADLPCGSTIGPISAAETGMLTVDIGAPQLAMHSIREYMAVRDVEYYVRVLAEVLYQNNF